MVAITTLSVITGRQKAAILMLALGETQSAKLLGALHADEISPSYSRHSWDSAGGCRVSC